MSKKELKKYFEEWEKEMIDNPHYNKPTKDLLLNCKKKSSYNWSKKALKNGITLKEIKKIEEYLDQFYSETCDGHVIRYYNGFVAAGILEIPTNHATIGINTIGIFSCGYNDKCDDIEIQGNTYLTLSETEDLAKVLNICIKKLKERL